MDIDHGLTSSIAVLVWTGIGGLGLTKQVGGKNIPIIVMSASTKMPIRGPQSPQKLLDDISKILLL